jgi:hypothetical protein
MATPVQSTLDGLSQLQLKVRMLEEDRDYHCNLLRGSEREYVTHRAQLDELLRKQRRVHHERESALTRAIAHLHEEAAMLRRALEEASEQQQRAAERLRREDAAAREAAELRVRADLAAASSEANQREEELEALRRAVAELRAQRERRHARIHRLEADQRRLNLQLTASASKQATGRVAHPFLPSGPSAKERVGLPTSQNVHAFAQTWQRATLRNPGGDSPLGRRSPARPTRTGLVSAELERKLTGELRALYRQCATLASHLSAGDDAGAGGAARAPVSGGMRDVFAAIDAKQRQLHEVRTANVRLASTDSLDQGCVDADEAKIAAETTHAALVNVLRSSSFVPERAAQ